MKFFFFLFILLLTISCGSDKGVYWCGDHPCINKKEKEAYFKKNMVVEMRSAKKTDYKNNSEIKQLMQEAEGKEKRSVLRFHPDIAPFQIAVLPLSRNDKLVPTARRVYDILRPHFNTQYDDSQSIGRRYRRQDEIGTPLCVTVDFNTVEDDDAVTIRNRDSMEQIRVGIENIEPAIREQLNMMREDCQG